MWPRTREHDRAARDDHQPPPATAAPSRIHRIAAPRNAYLPSPAPASAQRVIRNTGPRCRTCFRRAGVTHRRAAGRSTDTGITCAAPSSDTRQLAPQGFALGRLPVGAGAVGDTGIVLTAISIGLLIDEGRTVDTKCAIRHSH